MKTKHDKLTEKQRAWLKHIEAAREQNIPLSRYAKENKLSLISLYGWNKTLKSKGVIGGGKARDNPFVRAVPQHTSGMHTATISFANHTQVEVTVDPSSLMNLLSMVKAL
ncbi:MAG: hypothetical protein OEZ68_02455 [Gammaproteobacteria bacterium]|nr:hypothetical protein [Gammaproteobacteria bacterium]MDH5799644.1 hypothetical protein [Gammaproteobacteria bacterium]